MDRITFCGVIQFVPYEPLYLRSFKLFIKFIKERSKFRAYRNFFWQAIKIWDFCLFKKIFDRGKFFIELLQVIWQLINEKSYRAVS